MSPPRARPGPRAVTERFAWRFAVAYAGVRVVRLLQVRGHVPGGGGLEVRGRHVHHYLYGGTLLASQLLVTAARKVPSEAAHRANVGCIGVALIVDEFDLLLRCEQSHWARRGRGVVDAALVAVPLAAHGWSRRQGGRAGAAAGRWAEGAQW